MFKASIRRMEWRGKPYHRVCITSDDPSLCSEHDVVCYIKPRSRHENLAYTLGRATQLAHMLSVGEKLCTPEDECESQS